MTLLLLIADAQRHRRHVAGLWRQVVVGRGAVNDDPLVAHAEGGSEPLEACIRLGAREQLTSGVALGVRPWRCLHLPHAT